MARNKYPEVTEGRILDVATQLFLEKGFESTTIQDIINALGDLSKGAIYHHFKSKEDIIIAVYDRIYSRISVKFNELINEKGISGLEKLKQLFIISLQNPDQEILMQALPDLQKNPKLMVLQLNMTTKEIGPNVICPIIKQGIEDGSIKIEYPEEFSELLAMLVNFWLNPFIFRDSEEKYLRKFRLIMLLMERFSINIFGDKAYDAMVISKIEQLRRLWLSKIQF